MRRLCVAIMLWFVLLALVLGALAPLALADDCTGTHWLCGTWYDTCCARGCTVTEYWPEQHVECFELMIPVGPMQYPAACHKYLKTAKYYTCPTQEPPCTVSRWYLDLFGYCD